MDTWIKKISFCDNENKHFLGWPNQYFGYKRSTVTDLCFDTSVSFFMTFSHPGQVFLFQPKRCSKLICIQSHFFTYCLQYIPVGTFDLTLYA